MPRRQIDKRAEPEQPPLAARFKARLILGGHTVASWARAKGHHESLVWMNLSDVRTTPAIRSDIASVLDMSEEQLDLEIASEVTRRAQGVA